MKGATAEPFASTKSNPSKNITMIMGASQSFFRATMNRHNSLIKVIVLITRQEPRTGPLGCQERGPVDLD